MKRKFLESLLLLLPLLTISLTKSFLVENELIVNFSINKIVILTGNSETIHFTVQNNGANSIRINNITANNENGMETSDPLLTNPDLQPGDVTEGSFEVSASSEIHCTGEVSLVIHYASISGEMISSNQISYYPIEYEIIPYPIAAEMMDINTHTADESIYEKEIKEIYIEIFNKSSFPITITGIQTTGSDYLEIFPETCIKTINGIDQIIEGCNRSLSDIQIILNSNQSVIIPLYINLTNTYPHHNLLSIFTLNFQYNWGEIRIPGSISTEINVNAGSFEGEKEILNVLGIPIFLLLPGFFIITIMIQVWNLAHKDEKSSIEYKQPIFWLLTVVISIIFIPIYKYSTGLYGQSRDILTGFDTNDITWISIGSLTLGFLLGIIANLLDKLLSFKYPTLKDKPEKVLLRMLFASKSFKFDRYKKEKQDIYLLMKSKKGDSLWFSPRINIQINEKQILPKINQLVIETEGRSIFPRIELLRRIHDWKRKEKIASINWESDQGIMELPSSSVVEEKKDKSNIINIIVN